MKKILATISLLLFTHLYIGYYISEDMEDKRYVVFIKKYPTLQIRFHNIYTRDTEVGSLDELSMERLNMVKNYCKYRLGIDTKLKTQEELEACKKR